MQETLNLIDIKNEFIGSENDLIKHIRKYPVTTTFYIEIVGYNKEMKPTFNCSTYLERPKIKAEEYILENDNEILKDFIGDNEEEINMDQITSEMIETNKQVELWFMTQERELRRIKNFLKESNIE